MIKNTIYEQTKKVHINFLVKIFWRYIYKTCAARHRIKVDGIGVSLKEETIFWWNCPTRSWSACPAPVHPCIASLLHPLISYHWWQVHPQSLCQQQGCLPWFLPCCVLICLQCMQRTWHFLHKPRATRPRCSAVGGIDGCTNDGAAARRRSINTTTGWPTNSAASGFKDREARARGRSS